MPPCAPRVTRCGSVPRKAKPLAADILAFRECWNGGRFFEAHETLEPRWIRERDAGLQGLIQLAAAFHHLQRGNLRGARTMLRRAMPRLRDPAKKPCEFDQQQLAEFAAAVDASLDGRGVRELIESRPRL